MSGARHDRINRTDSRASGGGIGDSNASRTGSGAAPAPGSGDSSARAGSGSGHGGGLAPAIRERIARIAAKQRAAKGAGGDGAGAAGQLGGDNEVDHAADGTAGPAPGISAGGDSGGSGNGITADSAPAPSPAPANEAGRVPPAPVRQVTSTPSPTPSAPPEPGQPPVAFLKEAGIDPASVPKKRGRPAGGTNAGKVAAGPLATETDPRKVLEWIELGANGAYFATRHEHWNNMSGDEKVFLAERVAKCIDTLPESVRNSVVKKALDLTPWFGLATGYLTIIHPRIVASIAIKKAQKNERINNLPRPESEPRHGFHSSQRGEPKNTVANHDRSDPPPLISTPLPGSNDGRGNDGKIN